MRTRTRPFGPSPLQGGFSYYIQRGATMQTYRALTHEPGTVPGASAQAIDTLIACPFPVGLGCRLDRIGFNVTALAAGSSGRVGLYRAISARNVYPGALVVDSGAILTTSNGWKEANVDTPLRPGLYWSVYLAAVLAPSVSTINIAGAAPRNPILGWTAANPPAGYGSLRVAFAFAALPAAFPGGAALNAGPSTLITGRFSA
jgi:hypothetical protein